MATYKKGSKGKNVTLIQQTLGIKADGVFGAQTEEAVKAWQSSHGLDPDGIVGSLTWQSLGIADTKCVDPSVIYAPLSSCITKTPGRTIKYLAIHYTAGASSAPGTAVRMKAAWESTKRASADFGVDDRDMVQFNPDPLNYRCWAVGDKKNAYSGGGQLYGKATNSNTISIEICSTLAKGTNSAVPNHEGWTFTQAALANAERLAKILMRRFSIPKERVVRHYDISGKLCPGVPGWNNGQLFTTEGKPTGRMSDSRKWEEFKKKL